MPLTSLRSQVISVLFIAALPSLPPPTRVEASAAMRTLSPIILGLNEQRLLSLPGMVRYSMGSPAIRAVMPPGGLREEALLIKGMAAGVSDLWVWKRDNSVEIHPIQVQKWQSSKVPMVLFRILEGIDEVELIIGGDRLVLRGQIQSRAQAERIYLASSQFSKWVVNQTSLSPQLLSEGERAVSAWVRSQKTYPGLEVQSQDGALRVVGQVPRASDRQKIAQTVTTLFGATELDLELGTDLAAPVMFRVFLLELKRTAMSSLGLSWPGATESAFTVTTDAVRSALKFDLALRAMESNGSARVLAKPELVVRVPGESELFAGGELPLREVSQESAKVTWRQHGLRLKLTTSTRTFDRVRLDIQTELSHLEPSMQQDDIPGMQVNQLKTQVDASFGEPLFLCGLLQENFRTQAHGLPFLRKIPVLGALFGSEDYLSERSELVAVILPHRRSGTSALARIETGFPLGRIPPPRNWISPDEELKLKESRNFPWNAL